MFLLQLAIVGITFLSAAVLYSRRTWGRRWRDTVERSIRAFVCASAVAIGFLVILLAARDARIPMGSWSSNVPRAIRPILLHPHDAPGHDSFRARVGRPPAAVNYGGLPLSFEPNQGQTDQRVRFLSRGNGYSLFLTSTEAVLALRGSANADRSSAGALRTTAAHPLTSTRKTSSADAVLRMTLVGANPSPEATRLDLLPGDSNYFIGNDSSKWRTDVPNYGKVRFAAVYPGVDLVYYGNQRRLEYDFVVAPAADPGAITLRFAGAERVEIDPQGELALQTGAGEVRWHKPVIYQEINGVRQTVDGRYIQKAENSVGFEIASYDPRSALVIDPVLDYSTYLGGTSNDLGNGIAVDATGNAYVVGTTFSTNFPVSVGAFQTVGTGYDAFVAKFNSAGSRVYATYLGGADTDTGVGVAVDALGNAYVTGVTRSLDYPVTLSAFQAAYQGGVGRLDTYVAKLNPTGNALLYSTYLGGTDDDIAMGIAVDSSNTPNGNVYVTGNTTSTNFPTLNGFARSGYGYVTALNTTRSGISSLVYSTYLGNVTSHAIAADLSGNVYVTGQVLCDDTNPGSAFQNCGVLNTSPFVMKILTTGSNSSLSLIYTQILDAGSGQTSVGTGIAVDSAAPANIYVTGYTNSLVFPGAAASTIQNTNQGGNDAFVVKLNNAGTLMYSTYLGGHGDEQPNAIAVDTVGNAYVTGQTNSGDFPSVNAIQSSFGGGPLDAFVAKINPLGTALKYSTYLGGVGSDWGAGIAADSSGAYITGGTSSFNFPVANAFRGSLSGVEDAFVAKIVDDTPPPALPPTIAKVFGAIAIPFNTNTTLTFTLGNPNATSLSGVAFTDPLPTGMTVATSNSTTNSCGGTVTAAPGSGSVFLVAGVLPANGTCTVAVTVTGASAGSWTNITGNVTSVEGGSGGTASATLAVQSPLPPTIAKAFGASSIPLNTNTALTFTLGNPNSASLSGVAFTDPLPTGMTVAASSTVTNACGGTVTAAAGSGSIALVGGGLPASGTCTIVVTVTGASPGSWTNVTGNVASVEGGSGATASATLTVLNIQPPTIAKAFGAPSIPLALNTSLTFTLGNPNATPLSGVAFTDSLPTGMIVANPNGLSGSCGGTVTASPNSSSVSLVGGTLAGSGTCSFSVTITGNRIGSWNNVTGSVTSAEGGTGLTAAATLTVAPPPPNCQGLLISNLAQQYGGVQRAASALGYPSVQALQDAIRQRCGG